MKIFNRISGYVAIAMAASAIFGCQQEELVKPDALMSESSLTFEAKGAEPQTFMVASDDDWIIDVAEDWITVDPMSGSQTMDVTVTVSDNVRNGAVDAPRQGTVTILNKRGYSVKTVIYQKGDNYLGVSEMPISDVYTLEDGNFAKVSGAQVVALTAEGFVATDESASIYVTSSAEVKLGSKVFMAGEKVTLNGMASLKAGDVTVESEGEVTRPAPVDLVSNLDPANAGKVVYVSTLAGILGRTLYYDETIPVTVTLLDPKAGDVDLDAVNMHNIAIEAYFVGLENGTVTLAVTKVEDKGINENLEAYFYDDFSWMKPFIEASGAKVGDSIGENNASADAPNLRTTSTLEPLLEEFLARGYEDLNQAAKVIYPQKYYWKFGKTDNHGGIKLPEIEFKGSELVNAYLDFDWAAHMTGSGNIDNVQLVVEVEEGTGFFENGTNVSDPLYTTQTKGNLEWQHASVLIKGASNKTRITIRPLNFSSPTPDQQRWHLDNVKVKDSGIPYVDPVYANITLSDEIVTFEGNPDGPASIKIKSDNTWTLTKGQDTDWFTLDVYEGAADEEVTVTVTCQPSTSLNLRHGVITLASADTRKNIHVVQSAAGGELDPLISLASGNNITVLGEGDTFTATVQSNVEYSVEILDDWISENLQSTTMGLVEKTTRSFTAETNMTGSERTGHIRFYNEENDIETILNVRQEAFIPRITVTPVNYPFEGIMGAGMTMNYNVDANIPYTVTTDAGWIGLPASTGEAGVYTIPVTFDSNDTAAERTGKVTFTNSTYSYSLVLDVRQYASGVVYNEDFEWLGPWSDAAKSGLDQDAGQTVETDDLGAYAPQLPTPKVDGVSALAALEAKGYDMLRIDKTGNTNPGECIYLQKNYLKFGKTGYQGGIVLPEMSYVSGLQNAVLSFDWCPMKQGSGKIDPVNLIVVVANGSDEVQFEIPEAGLADGETLRWVKAEVELSGVTINSDTRITIKQTQWGVSTANRWFVDNIVLKK